MNRIAGYLTVIAASLLLWQAMAETLGIIPSPAEAAQYLYSNARLALADSIVTLENTLAGFALALLLALATAAAGLLVRPARSIVEALNVIVQSVSALVWAILFLIIFGVTSRVPAVGVAAATAYPILLSGTLKGFEVTRASYGELAQILSMGRTLELRYILVPGSVPFIVASGRSALGAALRISVVAEALGGSGGLGYRMWLFYQVHNYEGFMAWAMVLVALMVVIDKVALERLEEASRRWLG